MLLSFLILHQGIQEWADGRKYEGQFSENMMHGFGFYTYSDGKVYEGYFSKD